MRIILEILRIICILLIFGGLLSALLNYIYSTLGININKNESSWLRWIAIYFLLFVLYRNKLQFSGWYKGKEQRKLSKSISFSLIFCAIIMLLIIPLLG